MKVHDLNQSEKPSNSTITERPLNYTSSERDPGSPTPRNQMIQDIESTQEFETKYLNPECYEKV